jgi:hypothetical protein
MKKNTILWLLPLAPFFSYSQGVKANFYDKYLKKQRVETEAVSFEGLTGKTKLSIAFTALDTTLYLHISGTGWGTTTIDSGNELKLLFSNDSVITLKSTSLQGFEPDMLQNSYRHEYRVAANQFDGLTKYHLVGIRKYSFATFTDLMIPQQNKAKLTKLSTLFVTELRKLNLKHLRQIEVKDIHRYVGDSVEFCSKVYKSRYFSTSAEGPTLLDVRADFSDPVVNVVILQKDRQKFDGEPEKKYLDKKVCISGVVSLRNSIPTLVLQNREQIKVNSTSGVAETASVAEGNDTVADKNMLVAKQKTSLPIQPIALSSGPEKTQKTVQKDLAKSVEPMPIAEEKVTAEMVKTDNKTLVAIKSVRYKVRSKAYFHNEPDESTRRNAFIVHWNNAILSPLNEKKDFIYLVFTNHLGQVSKGWLSKRDLVEIK